MQEGLAKRAGTGVIFVLVMLFGLYGGRYSFVALFTVVTSLCLWEFLSLCLHNESKIDFYRKIIGVVFGMLPFALVSILQLQTSSDYIKLGIVVLFPIIFLTFIFELFADSKRPFLNIAILILGAIYIGTPFSLLCYIAFYEEYFYANTVFGLLVLTWANDTGAYLAGSKFGKHKLFPRISPKKSWEGAIGGFIVTLLIAWLISYYFRELNWWNWTVIAMIVSVFGPLGDLVESMLKRSIDVKDSGNLLPGHGGFLDRFDAFIFMMPYVAAYIIWVRG
ncbi:MAG: phosphatidate cytidylyltransferase [Saprospiraceae bacterium]|nr:phosphatidate cytidylyltransferase [Saprospiraceae bacterium]